MVGVLEAGLNSSGVVGPTLIFLVNDESVLSLSVDVEVGSIAVDVGEAGVLGCVEGSLFDWFGRWRLRHRGGGHPLQLLEDTGRPAV